MGGEILSISVVSRPSGDPYLTIPQISIILSRFAKMVPSPRPYRSGLVVRPPAWDPRGARFDSWCVFKSRCFWGGAKAFSAAKIDISQNKIGVAWIFMIFWWNLMIWGDFGCIGKQRKKGLEEQKGPRNLCIYIYIYVYMALLIHPQSGSINYSPAKN